MIDLVHLKAEGCAIHPDDLDCDFSEKSYRKQLKAYYNAFPHLERKPAYFDIEPEG